MTQLFKYSFVSILIAITVSSCIKEKYKIDFTDNTSRPIIEFTSAKDGVNSLSVPYGTQQVEVDLTEVRIPPRSVINKDVQVKVAVNNSLAAASGYSPPPAGSYSVVSTDLTLTPSDKNANVRIKINPSLIASGGPYAIGLTIQQASDGEISQLYKNIVIEVKVRNAYEGEYHATGTRWSHSGPNFSDPISATFTIDDDKYAYTIDATTIETDVADLIGGGWMFLTVDPVTNNVTVSPSTVSPTFDLSNNGPCTYSPATKTFSLKYKYYNASGLLREIVETLVLK